MAFQGGEPTLEVLLKFYLYSKEGKDGKELIKLDTVNKSNFNPPRINGDGAKITQPVEVENATENDSFVGDETKVTQPAKKESVVGGVTDLSIDIDSVNLSEENCNLKLRFVEKIHDEPINCLLVGFKGCGKSTFANAANKFQYFEECKSEGLEDDDKTIIYSDGVKFNFNAMMDRVKNKNERKIEYNEDMINVYEIYNQKNDKLLFNIIDTPGIEKDKDANVINQSFATLVDRVHHTSNIDCIDLIVFMVDWNHPEEIRLLHSALSSVMNSEEYSRAVENHAFYYIATKTPFNEGLQASNSLRIELYNMFDANISQLSYIGVSNNYWVVSEQFNENSLLESNESSEKDIMVNYLNTKNEYFIFNDRVLKLNTTYAFTFK